MRKCILISLILIINIAAAAGVWEDLNVKVMESGNSDEKGSTRYRLNDTDGRGFDLNYSDIPDETRRKRVIELKNKFYAWRSISITRMEFYFSADGIYINHHLKKIEYNGMDLMVYLPAGLAFQDRKEGLYYRFRIIVSNLSYMLEGIYTDEESLQKKIFEFIKSEEKKELVVEEKLDTAHLLSVYVSGYRLVPFGKLARVFDGGYGALAGITLHNTGISLNNRTLFNVDFTLSTGYWYYTMKKGIGDEYTCEADSAYIIPLILDVKYLFRPFQDFYIAPIFGVGMNYTSLDYIEPVSGGNDKLKHAGSFAPSLSGGVQLGYSIIRNEVSVFAGAEYMGMFERYMTATGYIFHAGVEYSFMTPGSGSGK